jgi:phosphonate transport system substrate-binding protein
VKTDRTMRKLWIVLLAVLLGACASGPSVSSLPQIKLSELQPLPTSPVSSVTPLRVSVAAVVSPQGTVESYQLLLNYLSQKLQRPVELVQRQTYSETNDLIEENRVDIAFVCTSAYIEGFDDFGMELLAAPQVNGTPTYQSVLIVPAVSRSQEIADLEGKVFAFTDPISFSGRVYPTYLVQQLGSTPETFFSRTFFTYNHDNAIRAVATGLADGAAVDSLVYDFAVQRDPSLAELTRIIHRSPAFGIPPVVINPHARPQLKATLQELLLSMASDSDGKAALEALGVNSFVILDDDAYDSARDIIDYVKDVTP